MRIAIAIANGRIAPVFDVARQVRVLDETDGSIQSDRLEGLSVGMPAAKVLRLAELEVNELICGAISAHVRSMIEAQGIQVTGFVAGDVDQLVHARLAEDLDDPRFAMPGCCGRGRRRGRRGRPGFGRDAAKEGTGMTMKERSPDAPGAPPRGGRGKGRGRRQARGGGQDQGRGMGRAAVSTGDGCVCPQCGRQAPHTRAVPCAQTRCPACGAGMVRKQED